MAQGNNDDLANLLSGMMDGDHPQEEQQHADEEPQTPAPARPAAPAPTPTPTPTPAPAPAARPAAPKPRAADPKAGAVRPPSPAAVMRPAAPAPISRPAAPAAPPPTPVEPAAPEPVAEETADVAAEQAMEPAAENETTYVDETITQAYGHDTVDAGDDAVIVPPPTTDMLAHTHAPKRPMRQQSMVQKLAFKQTIIPIMLTVGLICLVVVGMGLVAGEESPFKVFRMMGFAIPVTLIGLTLLGLGVLTMLQVKNELDKHKQAEEAAASASPH